MKRYLALSMAVNVLAAIALIVSAMTTQHSPYDVSIQAKGRVCHAQWCQPGQADKDAAAYVAQQVRALEATRTCWDPARPQGTVRTVLIHDVKSTLVREVTLTEGWALAQQGKAWIDAACA